MKILNGEEYPLAAGIDTDEGPKHFRVEAGEEIEVSAEEGKALLALEIGFVGATPPKPAPKKAKKRLLSIRKAKK